MLFDSVFGELPALWKCKLKRKDWRSGHNFNSSFWKSAFPGNLYSIFDAYFNDKYLFSSGLFQEPKGCAVRRLFGHRVSAGHNFKLLDTIQSS